MEDKEKKKVGRKWFDISEEDAERGVTEETIIAKCCEVWAIDGTDAEAAYYANVSKDSISRYLIAFPKVRELRDKLNEKPVLLARQTVIKKIPESYSNAMDYLSRKRKTEFSTRSEVDLNAKISISSILDSIEIEE